MIHDTACGRIVAYATTTSADIDTAIATAVVRSPYRWSANARIAIAMGVTRA